MAVTRRGYIFGAFLSGVLCVLLTLVAIASDSWVVSNARAPVQVADSTIRYGLWSGELVLHTLATPNYHGLYMTCVSDVGACAVSCKPDAESREFEVRALANRSRPNPACVPSSQVDYYPPLDTEPVISFGIYVSTLVFLFLQVIWGVIAALLTIINATMNPTEPVFGLPGCLWSNVITLLLGLIVMMMFGIYWASSGLSEHLAMSYIALDQFQASSGLGYSYWLLIGALACSCCNIVLLQVRNYLLERNPPPPTIKVDTNSDGTIFLY